MWRSGAQASHHRVGPTLTANSGRSTIKIDLRLADVGGVRYHPGKRNLGGDPHACTYALLPSACRKSGVMQASAETRRFFISWGRQISIVLLIVGVIAGPELLEPKDVVECEPVTVISFHQGFRSQRFTVAIDGTEKVREVGAANAPFGHEYRGPGVLALRRGRWTGREHWRIYTSCPRPIA